MLRKVGPLALTVTSHCGSGRPPPGTANCEAVAAILVVATAVHTLLLLFDLLQQALHLLAQASDALGGTPLLPLVLRRQHLQCLASVPLPLGHVASLWQL